MHFDSQVKYAYGHSYLATLLFGVYLQLANGAIESGLQMNHHHSPVMLVLA